MDGRIIATRIAMISIKNSHAPAIPTMRLRLFARLSFFKNFFIGFFTLLSIAFTMGFSR